LKDASLAILLSCAAGEARAHAPLARGLALGAEGAAAVAMPGFGWLVRGGAGQPFTYACEALLGVAQGAQANEPAQPMAYRGDGSLLIGTAAGLRALDARGCPLPASATGELASLPIGALALVGDGAIAYAAVTGASAGLYRSADGGEHWERRASLAATDAVTALLVAGDDREHVALSVVSELDMRAALLISEDGGATFERIEPERALTLLHAAAGEPARWWALAKPLDGKRGMEILRADQPAGPWTALLRVNFFGGFALDDSGVNWAGDEGGGVFRSDDGGDHFVEVAPDQAVACLAVGADGLWACTPGTSEKRAVAVANEQGTAFNDVVAFADVDRLVECGPDLDVSTTCAAAWTEWQVDVRMMNADVIDAGTSDAGTSDAGTMDAGTSDAGMAAPPPAETRPGTGCGVSAGASTAGLGARWLLVLACLLLARRRGLACEVTRCARS
jgi:hypothetical protein